MTAKQRESSAKYLYDLSKGIILLTVVSPMVTGQFSATQLALGIAGTFVFFLWAYWLEGKK